MGYDGWSWIVLDDQGVLIIIGYQYLSCMFSSWMMKDFFMHDHRLSWLSCTILDYDSLSWVIGVIMDISEMSWMSGVVMDCHGSPWMIMAYHRLSRVIMSFLGFP